MKIERTNYEVWLQDWLDGNLTGSEAEALRLFLENNPDIRSELEGTNSLKLDPVLHPFNMKDKLKRNLKDIPESQFEILCAAYLENDLQQNQKAEVDEMIAGDRDKLQIFKAISAMKLSPPCYSFENKMLLVKKEPSAVIYRLVYAVLSAAAVIAFILVTGVLRHDKTEVNKVIAAEITPAESQLNEPVRQVSVNSEEKQTSGEFVETVENYKASKEIEPETSGISDSFGTGREPVIIARAEINSTIPLIVETSPELVVSSREVLRETPDYDNRSNTGKFIARIFRKEIMKEEAPSESPLKAYEIAEAGVKGMNRLLGWDMAISRNTDENGEIKSVYFSSRVISFRTPVKKNEKGE